MRQDKVVQNSTHSNIVQQIATLGVLMCVVAGYIGAFSGLPV